MKKIVAICSIASLLLACKSKAQTQKEQTKSPNIVVVLIDDAGFADFGFMGSKDLSTPNIDKLAQSGVVFTDAHVSSTVCAPSRAGLITGKYQQRFGFECNGTGSKATGDIGLADDVITIADVFKGNNYKTIALGKWHLGYNEDDHPNRRGFDEFYGFLAGARSYFPLENPSVRQMMQQNGKRVVFDGYLTDVLTDRATAFMEENKEQPFFMYLAYNAVHTPMHAKEEDLKRFEGHPRQKLAAMTWSLDENIGKLVSKLEELDALENTLIFFLSDNGGATINNSTNGVLKGFKGNHYEGGHRVPFIFSWKGKTPVNKTYDGLTSSLDIFKTSIKAANIEEKASWQLDGVDLLPYLNGEKQGHPHDNLFWRKDVTGAARIGAYKMLYLEDFGTVLYDLDKDIAESNDLSKAQTQKLDDINALFKEWETGMVDLLWLEAEYSRKINHAEHRGLMQNKYRTVKEMIAYNREQRQKQKQKQSKNSN